LCHIDEQKQGEFIVWTKRLYSSVYKWGSSRSFECVRFVLIQGFWERTVFIHCVNYLNFYLLRKLLWLQLHCIFSCTTNMHSAFSWATPRLFVHMIFSDMSEKIVCVESMLLVLWHTGTGLWKHC
jgi:hypothetical protein